MHVRNTVNVKVNLMLRLWGLVLKLYVHYDTNVRLIYRCDLISRRTTVKKYSREKGAIGLQYLLIRIL